MANFTQAPFRLGKKEIFLPNFTLTLLRTKHLPPTFASFLVPLSMNKLDMRDYLYHCYDIRVVSVRSYIDQQPVQQGTAKSIRPTMKRWTRPRAVKKMTVEMETPFVWPAEPDDYTPWNKDTYEKARADNDAYSAARGRLHDTRVNADDRASLREQAQALIEGKEKWRPGMDVRK
ncbi:hypothetical protein MBLNU459_g2874t1 [Dothideomycetes sp. NU459]